MRSILGAVLLLSLPSAVAAQPRAAKPGAAPLRTDSDCARAKRAGRACNIEIEPEDLEGVVPGDSGEIIDARKPVTHSNLIRLRTDFRREIVKAADRL